MLESGILFFHFLWEIGMLFDPVGYEDVPQKAA